MIGPRLANRILFVLSLAGAGVSLYLTLAHLNVVHLQCGPTTDCEKVARHWSAKGFGIPGLQSIPTAAFGLAFYVFMAAISFSRVVVETAAYQSKASRVQWLMALGGVAVSAWLTYMEAFVIHAWCRWCVASAIIAVLVFITSSLERAGARRVPPAVFAREGEVS